MRRNSRDVAIRAIIFGTLGVRSSLEVTEDPRARSLSAQLLSWLEQALPDVEFAEFHREILATPHGKLPRESQTEAYWRGEQASVLGWAIQRCDQPDPETPVTLDQLFNQFRILQPDTGEFISTACLRSQQEIEDYCALCITVRQERQVRRLQGDARATLQHINQSRLQELGLGEAIHRLQSDEVESLVDSTSPGTGGLYATRALAAEWLLGAGD